MKKIRFVLTAVLLMLSVSAFAQDIKVTGTVSDASTGEPVIGASVLLKGNATVYSMTDVDGRFSLKVPSDGVLEVSFLGYKPLEVPVAGKSTHNISMEPDQQLLDEVVVTAQGLTRKQKAIGYSAQKMKSEELTITHSTDFGNSIAGKVSGAQFWGKGGTTFDEGSIVLRGATSYSDSKGSEPIYVVNGVITGSKAFNMDDVEEINVLKGPAATALYGSRGANGAVIVTTKKAKEGKGTVELVHSTTWEVLDNHFQFNDLYGGGSTAASVTSLANEFGAGTYDYTSASYLLDKYGYNLGDGTYSMDYGSDENWGPRYDGTTLVRSALSWDPTSSEYGKSQTWQRRFSMSDLTRTGVTNNTHVALSKAGQNYSVRASVSNQDRQGVLYNTGAVRRGASLNLSFKPVKWLNADINYMYKYRRNDNAAQEGYSADGNVVCDWTQWGQTNVDISMYKDYLRSDGSWRTWNISSTEDLSANFHDNPYATLDNYNQSFTNNYHTLSGDFYANLPFNMKLGVRAESYITASQADYKYGSGSINWSSYYRTYQSQSNDTTIKEYLTWGDQFVDDRLSVEAALFAEQRGYNYYYVNGYTNGGLNVDGFYNLAGSSSTYSTNNSEEHFRTNSFYGTATVGWDDLVYLDGSIRYDMDSRLPSNNNGYLYGGGSVSFMASKLINAKWLNFWKVRGSVAQVGSTLDAYKIYPTYSVGTKKNGLNTMYRPTTQVNGSIEPTISTSYEIGTEFKMFGNRFWGDINFYVKNTENNIIAANVIPQSGYYYRTMNAGLVRNKGFEISLGGAPVRTKDWQWNVNFNIAHNNNTLVELTPEQDEYTIYWTRFYYAWYCKAIAGKPIGVITSAARWKTTEDGTPVLQKGNSSWGDVRPVYDLNNEKEVGNVQPKATGGFYTSLRYKNFSLAASLDFCIGGSLVSWTNMWGTGSGLLASTAKVNNRGVNEREAVADGGGVYMEGVDADGNPISGYVDAYRYYHYKAYYDCDSWVFDRSYVKLREVSLKYDVPQNFIQKLGIGLSGASISLIATNPWLIYSAVPNLDPSEIAGTSYNYLEGGSALSTKTYGFTIGLTF